MNEAGQREIIGTDDVAGSGLFLNAAFLDFADACVEVDVLPRPSEISELRRFIGSTSASGEGGMT